MSELTEVDRGLWWLLVEKTTTLQAVTFVIEFERFIKIFLWLSCLSFAITTGVSRGVGACMGGDGYL